MVSVKEMRGHEWLVTEMEMKRWLLNFVLVIALAFTGPPAARAEKVRLTLDYVLQGQQSPFILADEGGYFARAGVEVQVDRGFGSADAIAKVASGAYDMAFADIGGMIQFDGR